MQRRRKISLTSDSGASALLVFSICAVQYGINPPQCGAHEGHMRNLIGHLVARGGAERAAARMAVGIHQGILCEQFPGKQFPGKEGRERRAHAMIDAKSISTDTAFARISIGSNNPLSECVLTDSAPKNTYARKNFPRDAIAEIAGALPRFGVLD
jgi:hypothetical protein